MQMVPVAVVLSANVAVTLEGVQDREMSFLLYYDHTKSNKSEIGVYQVAKYQGLVLRGTYLDINPLSTKRPHLSSRNTNRIHHRYIHNMFSRLPIIKRHNITFHILSIIARINLRFSELGVQGVGEERLEEGA